MGKERIALKKARCFFIRKITKFDPQSTQKRCKSHSKQEGHKTRWKIHLHINILNTNCDFRLILGSPGLPKWAPKWTLGVKIRTKLGSWGAKGAPGANFNRFSVNFDVILGPQIAILEPYWRLFGAYSSKLQLRWSSGHLTGTSFAANSSK